MQSEEDSTKTRHGTRRASKRAKEWLKTIDVEEEKRKHVDESGIKYCQTPNFGTICWGIPRHLHMIFRILDRFASSVGHNMYSFQSFWVGEEWVGLTFSTFILPGS